MTKNRICKDCLRERGGKMERLRQAPYPGPRCFRHHKARQRAQKARTADLRLEARYGLTREEYDRLLASQGGRCALCRRVIGVKRRATVDHDHNCTQCGGVGCRFCVRGLLDALCNKDVLGRFGDDPARFDAIADYLRNPPAQQVIALSETYV